MRFLMFSQSGEGAQILSRIEQEGNEVGLYIKDPLYQTVFDGILPKVKSPDEFIDKNTVIIFDMSGNGKIADSYKKSGYLVYGGSEFADKLEHDRQFGFEIMKKAGIKIPEYEEFTDFSVGKTYIKEKRKRLVFKPTGSMPTKLTYCASSDNPDELIAYLSFVEQHFGKHISSFILQDFIEGIVISSEFFSLGESGFLSPANHTVEVKKSMNDELGPSTGCSGNITWICEDDNIIINGIGKIQDLCTEEDYIGQIDLNAVVNEDGVYGLEWTPRFGYDATPTFLTLLNIDFGEFFYGLSGDTSISEANIFGEEFAGSVRVTIPPYPIEPGHKEEKEIVTQSTGVPIQNYEKYCEDLYFYEVCSKDGDLYHSNGTGVIACALGVSDDAAKSLDNPYIIVKELCIPDKQYRTDLKEVLSKMVEESLQYA